MHLARWDAKGAVRKPKKGERGYAATVVASMRESSSELAFLLPSDVQNAKAFFWKGALLSSYVVCLHVISTGARPKYRS